VVIRVVVNNRLDIIIMVEGESDVVIKGEDEVRHTGHYGRWEGDDSTVEEGGGIRGEGRVGAEEGLLEVGEGRGEEVEGTITRID